MAKETKPSIRVVLVEDNPHYRSTLETFFEVADGFELLHVFGSAEACLNHLERALRSAPPPDWQMVLMDVELPGINGIEATRRLKAQSPVRGLRPRAEARQ